MSPTEPDNEFEDFLARRSALLQRMADRDGPEPPPELDRIVLARAREAIEAPAHQPMYRAPRWALPVALAATLVLSIAVTFDLYRSGQKSSSTQLTAAVAPAPAPLPPAAMKSEQASSQAFEPALARARERAPAEPAIAMAKTAESVTPPAELAVRAKRVDAQAWLAQIERLRADGKVTEADEQLAEYRKAFPRRAAPSAAAPVPPSR
ncbi:MAG: hypothetical protein ABI885_28480 [Gammaproteobacteria bacterium]